MPPLIPSFVLFVVYLIPTILGLLLVYRQKDYTAMVLLPGIIYVSILYGVIDFMPIEAARVWVRWGILTLGVQMTILLAWKYFILGSRK